MTTPVAPPQDAFDNLIERLGLEIKAHRTIAGLTQAELATKSGLSVRFLADVELGKTNVSLQKLVQITTALGIDAWQVLKVAENDEKKIGSLKRRCVALLGLRGAGKSTVGQAVADTCGVPFIELDREIEKRAKLPVGTLMEINGEAYYRRLERDVLFDVLQHHEKFIVAPGGSIVTDEYNFRLLREHAITIWLKATPVKHWKRVLEQGDDRPMRDHPDAFRELENLMSHRAPLYSAAAHTIETTHRNIETVASKVKSILLGL